MNVPACVTIFALLGVQASWTLEYLSAEGDILLQGRRLVTSAFGGADVQLVLEDGGKLQLYERKGDDKSPYWTSDSGEAYSAGPFALLLTSDGDLVVLGAGGQPSEAWHQAGDPSPDAVLQALSDSAADDSIEVVWSRVLSGVGTVKELALHGSGDLVAHDEHGDRLWHTRTESTRMWMNLLISKLRFGGKKYHKNGDFDGWERYWDLRYSYSSDHYNMAKLSGGIARQHGGEYCGGGDISACEPVVDMNVSSLHPGQMLPEGRSLYSEAVMQTVEGKKMQGVRNAVNWLVSGAEMEIKIETRSGKPWLNAAQSKLTMQSDGRLVLRYREHDCDASSFEHVELDGGAILCQGLENFDLLPFGKHFCRCLDNPDRNLLAEMEAADDEWHEVWATSEQPVDPAKHYGPFSFVVSTGGDLEVVDGQGGTVWSQSTGDAGPIQCARISAIKRRPRQEDWDDANVNLGVYRSDAQHRRDMCGPESRGHLTMTDPDLVWTTAVTGKPVPGIAVRTKSVQLQLAVARTDDPMRPYCGADYLELCEEVPEGADEMRPGQVLRQGRALRTDIGELVMQTDGNLVLHLGTVRKKVLWSSKTPPGHSDAIKQVGPYALVFTYRAELAIVDGRGRVLWFVDGPALYINWIKPTYYVGLDKMFSPATFLVDAFDRGLGAAFTGNVVASLYTSNVIEVHKWRFRLQSDGNAVLFCNGNRPVFRTNTAGWHMEDDEWPQAVLSEDNVYGDAWTRFDPRSGDSFFQWNKFAVQFGVEIAGDIAVGIASGGMVTAAKYGAKGIKAVYRVGLSKALKQGVRSGDAWLVKMSLKSSGKWASKSASLEMGTLLKLAGKSVKTWAEKKVLAVVSSLGSLLDGAKQALYRLSKASIGSVAKGLVVGVLKVAWRVGYIAFRITFAVGKLIITMPFEMMRPWGEIGVSQVKAICLLADAASNGILAKAVRSVPFKLRNRAILSAEEAVVHDVMARSASDAMNRMERGSFSVGSVPKRSYSVPDMPKYKRSSLFHDLEDVEFLPQAPGGSGGGLGLDLGPKGDILEQPKILDDYIGKQIVKLPELPPASELKIPEGLPEPFARRMETAVDKGGRAQADTERLIKAYPQVLETYSMERLVEVNRLMYDNQATLEYYAAVRDYVGHLDRMRLQGKPLPDGFASVDDLVASKFGMGRAAIEQTFQSRLMADVTAWGAPAGLEANMLSELVEVVGLLDLDKLAFQQYQAAADALGVVQRALRGKEAVDRAALVDAIRSQPQELRLAAEVLQPDIAARAMQYPGLAADQVLAMAKENPEAAGQLAQACESSMKEQQRLAASKQRQIKKAETKLREDSPLVKHPDARLYEVAVQEAGQERDACLLTTQLGLEVGGDPSTPAMVLNGFYSHFAGLEAAKDETIVALRRAAEAEAKLERLEMARAIADAAAVGKADPSVAIKTLGVDVPEAELDNAIKAASEKWDAARKEAIDHLDLEGKGMDDLGHLLEDEGIRDITDELLDAVEQHAGLFKELEAKEESAKGVTIAIEGSIEHILLGEHAAQEGRAAQEAAAAARKARLAKVVKSRVPVVSPADMKVPKTLRIKSPANPTVHVDIDLADVHSDFAERLGAIDKYRAHAQLNVPGDRLMFALQSADIAETAEYYASIQRTVNRIDARMGTDAGAGAAWLRKTHGMDASALRTQEQTFALLAEVRARPYPTGETAFLHADILSDAIHKGRVDPQDPVLKARAQLKNRIGAVSGDSFELGLRVLTLPPAKARSAKLRDATVSLCDAERELDELLHLKRVIDTAEIAGLDPVTCLRRGVRTDFVSDLTMPSDVENYLAKAVYRSNSAREAWRRAAEAAGPGALADLPGDVLDRAYRVTAMDPSSEVNHLLESRKHMEVQALSNPGVLGERVDPAVLYKHAGIGGAAGVIADRRAALLYRAQAGGRQLQRQLSDFGGWESIRYQLGSVDYLVFLQDLQKQTPEFFAEALIQLPRGRTNAIDELIGIAVGATDSARKAAREKIILGAVESAAQTVGLNKAPSPLFFAENVQLLAIVSEEMTADTASKELGAALDTLGEGMKALRKAASGNALDDAYAQVVGEVMAELRYCANLGGVSKPLSRELKMWVGDENLLTEVVRAAEKPGGEDLLDLAVALRGPNGLSDALVKYPDIEFRLSKRVLFADEAAPRQAELLVQPGALDRVAAFMRMTRSEDGSKSVMDSLVGLALEKEGQRVGLGPAIMTTPVHLDGVVEASLWWDGPVGQSLLEQVAKGEAGGSPFQKAAAIRQIIDAKGWARFACTKRPARKIIYKGEKTWTRLVQKHDDLLLKTLLSPTDYPIFYWLQREHWSLRYMSGSMGPYRTRAVKLLKNERRAELLAQHLLHPEDLRRAVGPKGLADLQRHAEKAWGARARSAARKQAEIIQQLDETLAQLRDADLKQAASGGLDRSAKLNRAARAKEEAIDQAARMQAQLDDIPMIPRSMSIQADLGEGLEELTVDGLIGTGVTRYDNVDILPVVMQSKMVKDKVALMMSREGIHFDVPLSEIDRDLRNLAKAMRKADDAATEEMREQLRAVVKRADGAQGTQALMETSFPIWSVKDVYDHTTAAVLSDYKDLVRATLGFQTNPYVRSEVIAQLALRRPVMPQAELATALSKLDSLPKAKQLVEEAAGDMEAAFKAFDAKSPGTLTREEFDVLASATTKEDAAAALGPAIRERPISEWPASALMDESGQLTAIAERGLQLYDSMPSTFFFNDRFARQVGFTERDAMFRGLAEPFTMVPDSVLLQADGLGVDQGMLEKLVGSHAAMDEMGSSQIERRVAEYNQKPTMESDGVPLGTFMGEWCEDHGIELAVEAGDEARKAEQGEVFMWCQALDMPIPESQADWDDAKRLFHSLKQANERYRTILSDKQLDYIRNTPKEKKLSALFDPSNSELCLTNGQTDELLGKLSHSLWQTTHDRKGHCLMMYTLEKLDAYVVSTGGQSSKSAFEQLKRAGLTRQEVRGRGNCYFDAVMQSAGDIQDQKVLRAKYVEAYKQGVDAKLLRTNELRDASSDLLGPSSSLGVLGVDANAMIREMDRTGLKASDEKYMAAALGRPYVSIREPDLVDGGNMQIMVFNADKLGKGQSPVMVYLQTGHATAVVADDPEVAFKALQELADAEKAAKNADEAAKKAGGSDGGKPAFFEGQEPVPEGELQDALEHGVDVADVSIGKDGELGVDVQRGDRQVKTLSADEADLPVEGPLSAHEFDLSVDPHIDMPARPPQVPPSQLLRLSDDAAADVTALSAALTNVPAERPVRIVGIGGGDGAGSVGKVFDNTDAVSEFNGRLIADVDRVSRIVDHPEAFPIMPQGPLVPQQQRAALLAIEARQQLDIAERVLDDYKYLEAAFGEEEAASMMLVEGMSKYQAQDRVKEYSAVLAAQSRAPGSSAMGLATDVDVVYQAIADIPDDTMFLRQAELFDDAAAKIAEAEPDDPSMLLRRRTELGEQEAVGDEVGKRARNVVELANMEWMAAMDLRYARELDDAATTMDLDNSWLLEQTFFAGGEVGDVADRLSQRFQKVRDYREEVQSMSAEEWAAVSARCKSQYSLSIGAQDSFVANQDAHQQLLAWTTRKVRQLTEAQVPKSQYRAHANQTNSEQADDSGAPQSKGGGEQGVDLQTNQEQELDTPSLIALGGKAKAMADAHGLLQLYLGRHGHSRHSSYSGGKSSHRRNRHRHRGSLSASASVSVSVSTSTYTVHRLASSKGGTSTSSRRRGYIGNCVHTNMTTCQVLEHDTNILRPGQLLKYPHRLIQYNGDDFAMLQVQRKCSLELYWHYEDCILGMACTREWKMLWETTRGNKDYDAYGFMDQCTLVFDREGNLFLVNGVGMVMWKTDTIGLRGPVSHLEVQGDGNLVVYRERGGAIWSTETAGQMRNYRPTGELGEDFAHLRYGPEDQLCDKTFSDGCEDATGQHFIAAGQRLDYGHSLHLRDFELRMQGDGNLVLYSEGKMYWETGTDGEGEGPYRLIVDASGRVMVLSQNTNEEWDEDGFVMRIESEGRSAMMVLYNGKDVDHLGTWEFAYNLQKYWRPVFGAGLSGNLQELWGHGSLRTVLAWPSTPPQLDRTSGSFNVIDLREVSYYKRKPLQPYFSTILFA